MSGGPAPDVSVVIVSFNARDELLGCLRALGGERERILEIFVVDNASADGSARAVAEAHPDVRLIESPVNIGFSRANNLALRQARGRYALLLNGDARIEPDAVAVLARELDEKPRLGAVGPRTLNHDGSVQVSFGPDLTPWGEWAQRRLLRGLRRGNAAALAAAARRAARPCEPDWVSAACLMARLDALAAIGYFDEEFFLYEEDADLCRRLRLAGWRIGFTPAARAVHRLGVSMAQAPRLARIEYQKSHIRYYRKHNGPLLTLLLRCFLASAATLRLAASLGRSRAAERRLQAELLWLAIGNG